MGQPQFVPRMGAKRVLCHHLVGHCLGRGAVNAAALVNLHQLLPLEFGLVYLFCRLPRQFCTFGVGLRADRDIFTRRHGHGASKQRRNAGHNDGIAGRLGCCHAHNQAGGGNYPVIGAQHRSAQPADPAGHMQFGMIVQPAQQRPFPG